MNRPQLLVLCNAMADRVRVARGITTDSPAATRKVAMMAQVLVRAGVRTKLLSMGRGRQDGSGRFFASRAGRLRGVPVVYGPFLNRPILSEILSCWAPVPLLWRQRRRASETVVLLYNRMPAYLPAIWISRLLGYRVALDLEDGETLVRGWHPRAIKARLLIALTDNACNGGALLACSALANATKLAPQRAYYGVVAPSSPAPRFANREIALLLGGTVARSTGADLLATAIEQLRGDPDHSVQRLHLHVTGAGESLDRFGVLARTNGAGPRVTVHGRLDDAGYAALLAKMDVGLALKPNSGPLAHTTFPSKVVEMAAAGVLVVTTDISDVRAVLGSGAVYLEHDDPSLLADRLRRIALDPPGASRIAAIGRAMVADRCGPEGAGTMLRRFLFPGDA
jgi:glycosyltransferase involved in cell wall biosynthesis